MPVNGRRVPRHPAWNIWNCIRVAVIAGFVASAVASLGAGCAGVRESASTERIRVGGIEAPSRQDGSKTVAGKREQLATPLSVGEVRDRRSQPEELGRGAVSSWNPLLGTWVGTPTGPNWIPVPTPDSKALKLEESGALTTTFRSDAAKVLENEGLTVISASPPREKSAPLRLDLEIIEATALSKGNLRTFLDKGAIVVSFGFSATLVDTLTEDVLWRGWFGRKDTMEARYFSRGKYEEALNKVYRKALEDFGKEASGGIVAKILVERSGEY